jgi:prepilin-type processing-associated H-X9-DG protein
MDDGTSNTIAVAEIGGGSGRQVNGQFVIYRPASLLNNPVRCSSTVDRKQPSMYATGMRLSEPGRGARWADGAAGFAVMNTVLAPNQPSCAVDGAEAVDGFFSAGSEHPGGVHVLFVDGAVRFVSDSISTGNVTAPTLTPAQLAGESLASPHGVWGALGTRSGGEDPLRDF